MELPMNHSYLWTTLLPSDELFVNKSIFNRRFRDCVMKTLGEFIVEKQLDFSHATGELTALLSAIKLGAKIIHRDINKAGLVDILGASGVSNIQGEDQMKLDLFANEKLKAALKARGEVAGIGQKKKMTSLSLTVDGQKMPNMSF